MKPVGQFAVPRDRNRTPTPAGLQTLRQVRWAEGLPPPTPFTTHMAWAPTPPPSFASTSRLPSPIVHPQPRAPAQPMWANPADVYQLCLWALHQELAELPLRVQQLTATLRPADCASLKEVWRILCALHGQVAKGHPVGVSRVLGAIDEVQTSVNHMFERAQFSVSTGQPARNAAETSTELLAATHCLVSAEELIAALVTETTQRRPTQNRFGERQHLPPSSLYVPTQLSLRLLRLGLEEKRFAPLHIHHQAELIVAALGRDLQEYLQVEGTGS